MRVLVATQEGQGARGSDFCAGNEGELVYFSLDCDDAGATLDDGCGCRRALAGIVSHRATTTFKVVKADLSRGVFDAKLRAGLDAAGWLRGCSADEADDMVRDTGDEVLRIAAAFEPGTVLERRGDIVQPRITVSR